jgi:hypothetical protein
MNACNALKLQHNGIDRDEPVISPSVLPARTLFFHKPYDEPEVILAIRKFAY